MNTKNIIDISIPLSASYTGTHIISPDKIDDEQKKISEIKLDVFIGDCKILDLTNVKKYITHEDLNEKSIKPGERILLKTKNSSRGYNEIYTDYIYLAPSGAKYLASKKIVLVGIDGPSIKQKITTDNAALTEFVSKNIPILEGLNLSKTKEGNYFLVSPPLPSPSISIVPARPVLLT